MSRLFERWKLHSFRVLFCIFFTRFECRFEVARLQSRVISAEQRSEALEVEVNRLRENLKRVEQRVLHYLFHSFRVFFEIVEPEAPEDLVRQLVSVESMKQRQKMADECIFSTRFECLFFSSSTPFRVYFYIFSTRFECFFLSFYSLFECIFTSSPLV